MKEFAVASLRFLAALVFILGVLFAGVVTYIGRNILGTIAFLGSNTSLPTAITILIAVAIVVAAAVVAMVLVVLSYSAEDLHFLKEYQEVSSAEDDYGEDDEQFQQDLHTFIQERAARPATRSPAIKRVPR